MWQKHQICFQWQKNPAAEKREGICETLILCLMLAPPPPFCDCTAQGVGPCTVHFSWMRASEVVHTPTATSPGFSCFSPGASLSLCPEHRHTCCTHHMEEGRRVLEWKRPVHGPHVLKSDAKSTSQYPSMGFKITSPPWMWLPVAQRKWGVPPTQHPDDEW